MDCGTYVLAIPNVDSLVIAVAAVAELDAAHATEGQAVGDDTEVGLWHQGKPRQRDLPEVVVQLGDWYLACVCQAQ